MYSPCAAPSFYFFSIAVAHGVLTRGRTIKDAAWILAICSPARGYNGSVFVPITQQNVRSGWSLVAVRMPSEQSDYEPCEQCCSDSEQNVSGDSHPAQGLHGAGLHKLCGTRVPGTVFDGCPCLQQSDGQHTEDNHEDQAKVQRPKRELQWSLFPFPAGIQRTEAKQCQTETEHPVHAEQSCMTVDWS